MSEITRLTLVTHAITDAVLAARFATDEPLNSQGQTAAHRGGLPATLRPDLILTAPEQRTTQTATTLGLNGVTDPALTDLNCGAWAGSDMDQIPPDQLMSWLTDPEFRSHGGESITDLIERTRKWLTEITSAPHHIVAITHPAIVRASILITLDAPPISFWRLDIPPLTMTILHHRGNSWTLRATSESLAATPNSNTVD